MAVVFAVVMLALAEVAALIFLVKEQVALAAVMVAVVAEVRSGTDGTAGYAYGYDYGGPGFYGGGGGGNYGSGGGNPYTAGRNGAVRIIWPASFRSFPSTNTGDL